MAGRLALSVSQLNEYVRRLFQQDPLLREIELKGEISNLKFHQTGSLFFTLKDEQAAVSCVMYAQDASFLQVEPYDGMRIVATGSVGLYAKGGQYQFYVKALRAQGMGVLFERYQMLKAKLTEEGLFDPARKRPIPGFVNMVGVISSPTGAVIHDILSVSLRRNSESRIMLCPVRVQGAEAADEVVRAIGMLEQLGEVDVIILARGGGSIEDLWTFNEERVVRAVAACKKPVVSAIGHETDFTLCDFAADFRAPTPSAAAECVTPVREDLLLQIDFARAELRRTALQALDAKRAQLSYASALLHASHPRKTLQDARMQINHLREALQKAALESLASARQSLIGQEQVLQLLNPSHVLARGYAIVLREDRAVSSCSCFESGDHFTLMLQDGRIRATVDSLEQSSTAEIKEGC